MSSLYHVMCMCSWPIFQNLTHTHDVWLPIYLSSHEVLRNDTILHYMFWLAYHCKPSARGWSRIHAIDYISQVTVEDSLNAQRAISSVWAEHDLQFKQWQWGSICMNEHMQRLFSNKYVITCSCHQTVISTIAYINMSQIPSWSGCVVSWPCLIVRTSWQWTPSLAKAPWAEHIAGNSGNVWPKQYWTDCILKYIILVCIKHAQYHSSTSLFCVCLHAWMRLPQRH